MFFFSCDLFVIDHISLDGTDDSCYCMFCANLFRGIPMGFCRPLNNSLGITHFVPRTGRVHPSTCGCLLDKGHGSERRASGPGCHHLDVLAFLVGVFCFVLGCVTLAVNCAWTGHRGISLSIDARS